MSIHSVLGSLLVLTFTLLSEGARVGKVCMDECPPPEVHVTPKVIRTCMDNSAMTVDGVHIKRVGRNNFTLEGNVNILQDLNEDATLKFDVYKCADESSRDKAEHFGTFQFEKFCTMCGDKDRFWTPVISHMPQLSPCNCPMKAAVYEIDNAVITLDSQTASMPLLQGYFIVNVIAYTTDENSPISCVVLEAEVYKEED